ncbi:hypothetical protein QFZ51_002724 [Chitinophaga sp. W3I9]|uniref:hypothetical protein n=1 Tax=Chitinophaga sp. W3I9 TaxID=3373924 RepID=UPI003D1FD94B
MIYLDWNVFNQLEKISELPDDVALVYKKMLQIIQENKISTPYSNAHISDLYRGYVKNPIYTPAHLRHITDMTKNLCIVQYWGEPKIRIHYRQPSEFLESTAEEFENTAATFSSLFNSIDDPLMQGVFGMQRTMMRFQSIDESFRTIYSVNPIFSIIFPRTKVEMNQLALCEDLYDFARKIKTDYALYKNYRKFLTECQQKFPSYKNLYQVMHNKIIGTPKSIAWDDIWDLATPDFKPSSNVFYDKIIHLFTTTDLKGYNQDERFANLLDDALHCFYAAHCECFVTLDLRCANKAKLVYNKLKIPAKVVTPLEYISMMGM